MSKFKNWMLEKYVAARHGGKKVRAWPSTA